MSLKKTGQEILRLLDVFVHLSQKMISKKECGKMKILHMGKKPFIPLSLFVSSHLPRRATGQSFRYKITMPEINFKGLLPFPLKPVVKKLFLNSSFSHIQIRTA